MEAYLCSLPCRFGAGINQLPKITPDHINLTSFSKMKVNLAAQVLSKTVALALRRFFPDGDAEQTAQFSEMVNKFFDCLNVRSTTEYVQKHNDFLAPYSNSNDKHFDWLQNTFAAYLEEWLLQFNTDLEYSQRMTEQKCSSPSKPIKV